MSLCRVDTDRLRELASRLGAAAVALDDASSAATVLAQHGYPSTAAGLAGDIDGARRWAAAWTSSLAERADLIEAQRMVALTPTWTTRALLADAAANARLATYVSDPESLRVEAGNDFRKVRAELIRLVESGAAPAEIASFFGRHGEETAARLAAALPEVVGGLGGVPLDARFLANRVRLDAVRREPLADRATLDVLAAPHRRYLEFDWEAGRIVEWIGPLDATHVALFVPGAGVDMRSFDELAHRLEIVAALEESGGDLALVAALSYDTPPTVVHAALGGYADAAGPELVGLLAGLDLAGRHVSLVGHSYGSVVVGEALRLGLGEHLPEADVVALGSPGMRADHVSDLGVAPEHFWAALLPGDAVAHALHPGQLPRLAACSTSGLAYVVAACRPGPRLMHGANPADPSFGGRILAAIHPGGTHGDYLGTELELGRRRPNPVLRQLLLILTGRADQVSLSRDPLIEFLE